MITEVDTADGAWVTTSGWLRDVYGAGRSRHLVLGYIESFLAEHDIRHVPDRLPSRQDHPVFLYSVRTPAGPAIAAGLRLAELEAQPRAPIHAVS